jgi:hypothetical protein
MKTFGPWVQLKLISSKSLFSNTLMNNNSSLTLRGFGDFFQADKDDEKNFLLSHRSLINDLLFIISLCHRPLIVDSSLSFDQIESRNKCE